MRRYLTRKLLTYVLAFFIGATIDWGIPHLMPGDPVQQYLSKFDLEPSGYAALYQTMSQAFGTNLPLWDQYWHFWDGLVHGNLGVSIYDFPAQVTTLIWGALPYTLALLVPAITLSLHRRQPVRRAGGTAQVLDNTVLPVGYVFQATPYAWLALAMPFLFGAVWHLFPISGGYDEDLLPALSWTFIWSLLSPLVPAVPHGVPGELRRLGYRDAQPGDLRAGERQLRATCGRSAPASGWSAGTPTATRPCPSCPAWPWPSAW